MSLIINQGKQDTSNDKPTKQIYIDNDVVLKIEAITINQFKAGSLNIQFKILSGKYKDKIAFDKVDYDPNSKNSWKYRALRAVAGVPYDPKEPANIDIHALLLNKVIKADLSAYSYTDQEGNLRDGQNFKYKVYQPKATSVAKPSGSTTGEVTTNKETANAAAPKQEVQDDVDSIFNDISNNVEVVDEDWD